MSETLLKAAWEQVCMNLWAIRRSRAWQKDAVSWESYCKRYHSLSKSRAKLYVNFAKLCAMCREEYLPVPTSPDNVAPILSLTHKRWVHAYRVCLDYADGPVNAAHCRAIMEQFAIIARRRVPDHVLNTKHVRKATDTLARFEDGEKLADQVGVNGLGRNWKKAVEVVIEADQFAFDERGGPERK